ncbi:hypothetical protein RNJ44_01432 [Nakaseomyces bracarensis]|uniref:Uncharacterized protein n=1 Tax=Nakaseomyces bracarensis TaxID=273131 RepID=A0ABR4NPS4_9SACH
MRQVPKSLLLKQKKRLQRIVSNNSVRDIRSKLFAASIADVFQPLNPVTKDTDAPQDLALFNSSQILDYNETVEQFFSLASNPETMRTWYNNRHGTTRREWHTLEYSTSLYNSSASWRDVPRDVAKSMYLHGFGQFGPRRDFSLPLNGTHRYSGWFYKEPLTSSVLLYGSLLGLLGFCIA